MSIIGSSFLVGRSALVIDIILTSFPMSYFYINIIDSSFATLKRTTKSNMSAWKMCVIHLNQWDQYCFEISWFGSENMVARYILIEKERKTYNNNNNISNCKNDNNNARRVMSLGLERTWNLRLKFSFHEIFWRIVLKFFFLSMSRLFDKKINYIVLFATFVLIRCREKCLGGALFAKRKCKYVNCVRKESRACVEL